MRMDGKTAKARSQGANAKGFRTRQTVRKAAAVAHFRSRIARNVSTKQAERGRFVWPLLIEARDAGTASRTSKRKAKGRLEGEL